jgi:hypothetical protein
LQRTGNRTVRQAIAAAGAFVWDDFVHVVDVLHFRMDGALGADFTAETARDAETFDDSHFVHKRSFTTEAQRGYAATKKFGKLTAETLRSQSSEKKFPTKERNKSPSPRALRLRGAFFRKVA